MKQLLTKCSDDSISAKNQQSPGSSLNHRNYEYVRSAKTRNKSIRKVSGISADRKENLPLQHAYFAGGSGSSAKATGTASASR
jgi:hypothetical protein